MIVRDLQTLRTEWEAAHASKAAGGRFAMQGFDFQIHSTLRDAVAAHVTDPTSVAPLHEAVSDILVVEPSGRVVAVQAKVTGTPRSLRKALSDLWTVYLTAHDHTPDLWGNLAYEVRCQTWQVVDFAPAIDSWSPADSDDLPAGIGTDLDGHLAAFKTRVRLRTDPSPRSDLLELLATKFSARDPLGWIERWTARLIAAAVEGRDPARVGEELFSDLTGLRNPLEADRISSSIAILTSTFKAPVGVARGPYLAGEQPQPLHVAAGYFAEREWLVEPALRDSTRWLDGLRRSDPYSAAKLSIYWVEGRSGCGKSVLLLQMLSRLKEADLGPLLWLGNQIDALPDAVDFALVNARGDDQAIVALDDAFAPANASDASGHWRKAIALAAAASQHGRKLPSIVTCGPSEQLSALRRQYGDELDIVAWRVDESLDADNAAALEEWFTARTAEVPPAHLTSSNMLMVQRFFQYRTGATIGSFATRFKARLDAMASPGISNFVSRILALNRLYVGLPAASAAQLSDAERDALDALARDNHIAVSTSSGRTGTWLAHPHLADAIFRTWFGEGSDHQAAGILRDAIIESGTLGSTASERIAPLSAIRLAIERSHSSVYSDRLDLRLLPEILAAAYVTLASAAGGIPVEDLHAWIRLEQALEDLELSPSPRTFAALAVSDDSIEPPRWTTTAHAILGGVSAGEATTDPFVLALRDRLGRVPQGTPGLSGLLVKLARLTNAPADTSNLVTWVEDEQNWTESGWSFAYLSMRDSLAAVGAHNMLPTADKASQIARAWLRSPRTRTNSGWSYIYRNEIAKSIDADRPELLRTVSAFLADPTAWENSAWPYAFQDVLKQTQNVDRPDVWSIGMQWAESESTRHMPAWTYVFKALLHESAQDGKDRRAIVRLGQTWLRDPASVSPGWAVVFDALYGSLSDEHRTELHSQAVDWVFDEANFEDPNWSHLCLTLSRHLDEATFGRLLELSTIWVREPMNQFLQQWSLVFVHVVRLIDGEPRREVLEEGTRWLREWLNQPTAAWPRVAMALMRATDGRDQAELLALSQGWLRSNSTRDGAAWARLFNAVVDRTASDELDELATLGRDWLGSSAYDIDVDWASVLKVVLDMADPTQDLLDTATDRLASRSAIECADWGRLFDLAARNVGATEAAALSDLGLQHLQDPRADQRWDRATVLEALLSHTRVDRSGLLDREMAWLWDAKHWTSPSWNRTFQYLFRLNDKHQKELRQVGLQWLRSRPGDNAWGYVLEQILPLTSGQERAVLCTTVREWMLDPLNQDGAAFSRVVELALATEPDEVLDPSSVFDLATSWLRRPQNMVKRRWSFLFRTLIGQSDAAQSDELTRIAHSWLQDRRSTEDDGWPFVVAELSTRGDDVQLGLAEMGSKWLLDPYNFGRSTWGKTAEDTAARGELLEEPLRGLMRTWLLHPLSRQSPGWRRTFTAFAPSCEQGELKTILVSALVDPVVLRTPSWQFRYQDASRRIDVAEPSIEAALLSWVTTPAMQQLPSWPYVVGIGIQKGNDAVKSQLADLAYRWLRSSASTSGRGAIEDALLGKTSFEDLQPQQLRTGIVTGVMPYGAFVNLGGQRGLVHNTAMEGRLKLGETVTVKIESIDEADGKIGLSYARPRREGGGGPRRQPGPRRQLTDLKKDDVLPGKVTKVVEFGAFVDLGGISGLLHKSETGGRFLAEGQELRVRIRHVDLDRRKVSLSLLGIDI